jgi:hypothetical protein
MRVVNPLHRSDELHRDTGTYYRSLYHDAARIFTLLDSVSWASQLVLDDALDASKLFVRTLIPPLHRERFLSLRIDEQTYRNGKKKLLVYGQEDTRYGDNFYYGYPASGLPGGIELPSGVVDVDLCCDLPVDPSIVLIKNEHFFIRDGSLFFTDDLFERMPVVDGIVTIYLRGVSVDRRSIQDRLGVLMHTQGQSTREYLEFNNLAIDCLMEGTGFHRLTQLLSKLYDVPCTTETETIEETGLTESRRWLATNRSVYFAPLSAAFLYGEGETVQTGTILTDAIRAVRGIALGDDIPIVFERRFLGNEYRAGLIFPNEEVPLTLTNGYPVFRIVGRNDDIARFWNTFYSRTEDQGVLSHAAKGGRINPAKFIYANVLYPRAQIFLVRQDKCGQKSLPVINTHILRGLLPPGVLFSLLVVAPKRTLDIVMPNIETSPIKRYHSARTVSCGIRVASG